MNNDFHKRLKRLEKIKSSAFVNPVYIELLENDEREIYTYIDGDKKVFNEKEWSELEEHYLKDFDRPMIFIEDVPRHD